MFDDAFFNRNWAEACWDRWAGTGIITGPVRWLWALDSSAKRYKQRGSVGACLLPLRFLSQFFSDERKNQLLEGECSAYLSPMG